MFTSEGGMMKSMRKKAASVGATGIILSGIDEPGAGAKVAGAILEQVLIAREKRWRFTSLVIRFG